MQCIFSKPGLYFHGLAEVFGRNARREQQRQQRVAERPLVLVQSLPPWWP
jgi:hypothetical protein